MTARITWSDDIYEPVGRVGGIPLFTIVRDTRAGSLTPWKLRTRLPVAFEYQGGGTYDDAQAKAEWVLAAFVARLGAAFVDSEVTR